MNDSILQEILSMVEMPSRYLGNEINAIRKDHRSVDLRVVLAFPDLYEIGTSHFGMQILYQVINRRKDVLAERVFAPAPDLEKQLRSRNIPLFTLESHQPLAGFDIIGFSLLYEMNYTNILTILELSNIPFLAAMRAEHHPLIVAGGPNTCNPEPLAEIFDAMVIGDGEEVVDELMNAWLAWKKEGDGKRSTLLEMLAAIDGIYIPSYFEPETDANGWMRLKPMRHDHNKIKRVVLADLDDAPFPDRPVIPFGKPVHDRLRLEVARGCTRGCRFCQAGMIYRPVRERSMNTLLHLSDESIRSTGYEDVSLLSLSTGDYSCVAPLIQAMMERCATDQVAVSLPSLRAGTLTPELMNLIRKVRKTGFTIAPEAGSGRLRRVINKNINEDEIADTVQNAFRLGWRVIKLYFMIGLPTETAEDLEAIVDLVRKLRVIKRRECRQGRINVSVATFVPKSHTPFQWEGQISLEKSKGKIDWLRRKLSFPDIQFKWQNPEISILEGLWARGDRRLQPLLLTAFRLGCKLDGWSDHVRYRTWMDACEVEGIDVDFHTTRSRSFQEPLPWDHIDSGVDKTFLWREWQDARAGHSSMDCRSGECNQCGVCDFETIFPRISESCNRTEITPTQPPIHRIEEGSQYRIEFSKTGLARYLGHLEMTHAITRAIRRAGIPVRYSQGFHPKPKISFEDALPVGMESLQEFFHVTTRTAVDSKELVENLNAQLPPGLAIRNCRPVKPGKHSADCLSVTYRIDLSEGSFDSEKLESFRRLDEFLITRVSRKGKKRTIDLCRSITGCRLVTDRQLRLTLRSLPEGILRPAEVLDAVFNIESAVMKKAMIRKEQVSAVSPEECYGSNLRLV